MILKILLIYFIIMCWWFYSWARIKINFAIYTKLQLIFNFIVLIIFFILFVLGLRILNLFREYKSLDLYSLNLKFDFIFLVLILILLYSFRRLVFFLFKFCWFKLHWFLLSPNNLSSYNFYVKFYTSFFYAPARYSYKYLAMINICMNLFLICVLFIDLVFNNLVLDFSLWYLRYYSVFKLIFFCYKFTATKQQLVLDYYNYNLLYSGAADESEFHLNMDPDHRFMIGESMRYSRGVVREIDIYIPAKRKDLKDMQYFKQILE